ncbi:MAG: glycosyltransferase family 2 protein [Patescibacteria group bacterium]|jgi:hypothetical protein
MDLSVIIPSYNTVKETCECVESIYASLSKSTIAFEIIIFDNNSQDSSVQTIRRKFPKVTVIVNKTNLGYGKGNNKAVQIARGKHLLFLNSDILVLDRAIEKMYQYFTTHNEEFAILGARLRNRDLTLQPSAAPFYSLPVIFAALFLKGDYWGLTRYSPKEVGMVDWVSGACFMMLKKNFEAVGGFDENIFMYMDEVDFMYRARKQGLYVGFYPHAEFIHYGAFSTNKGTDVESVGTLFDGKKKPVVTLFSGFLYFYRKHNNSTELLMLKLLLMMKAGIGIFVGLLTGNSYLKQTYGEAYNVVKKS